MTRIIHADRLVDGRGSVLEDAGIAVTSDRIAAVGPRVELAARFGNAKVEAFPGCTVLPGLIDAHTHLMMPGDGTGIMEYAKWPDELTLLVAARNAALALQSGVTTVVDLGAKGTLTFRLREAIHRGIVEGSRLILCGRALTITGGHGWPWLGEADGVDGTRQAVRQLCKEGADLIKVMVTGGGTPGTDGRRPSYALEELRTIVEEAHSHNRKVVGHCTAAKGIARALEAGFDIIAHCQFLAPDGSDTFDERLAHQMAERGVAVNPTLQINRILASDRVPRDRVPPDQLPRLDAWKVRYPALVTNVCRLREVGVRLICGSDCGWGYSTFNETYLELDAMVEAGMTATEALVAATGDAADALGNGDRIGSLEPGKLADVLVVDGDPTRNILALRDVRAVWIEGRCVFDSLHRR